MTSVLLCHRPIIRHKLSNEGNYEKWFNPALTFPIIREPCDFQLNFSFAQLLFYCLCSLISITSFLQESELTDEFFFYYISLLSWIWKKRLQKIVNEKQCNLNIDPWTFLVCPQGKLTQKILHNSLFLGGPNKENKTRVLLELILCYLRPEYLHICPNTSITRIEWLGCIMHFFSIH